MSNTLATIRFESILISSDIVNIGWHAKKNEVISYRWQCITEGIEYELPPTSAPDAANMTETTFTIRDVNIKWTGVIKKPAVYKWVCDDNMNPYENGYQPMPAPTSLFQTTTTSWIDFDDDEKPVYTYYWHSELESEEEYEWQLINPDNRSLSYDYPSDAPQFAGDFYTNTASELVYIEWISVEEKSVSYEWECDDENIVAEAPNYLPEDEYDVTATKVFANIYDWEYLDAYDSENNPIIPSNEDIAIGLEEARAITASSAHEIYEYIYEIETAEPSPVYNTPLRAMALNDDEDDSDNTELKKYIDVEYLRQFWQRVLTIPDTGGKQYVVNTKTSDNKTNTIVGHLSDIYETLDTIEGSDLAIAEWDTEAKGGLADDLFPYNEDK